VVSPSTDIGSRDPLTPSHPLAARWNLARAILHRHEGRTVSNSSPALSSDTTSAAAELVLALRPSNVLELGSGRSTVALAQAARATGATALWSFEHDEKYLGLTQQELVHQGLDREVHLVHAPVRPHRAGPFVGLWYDTRALVGAPSFDLVLVDGPPARAVGRFMTLPLLWPRLRPGALLLLDDANRRKLEAVWLDLWQRIYGSALAVARHDRFHKGLGLIMKCHDRRRPLSASTWWHYLVSTLDHASRMAVRHVREGWR